MEGSRPQQTDEEDYSGRREEKPLCEKMFSTPKRSGTRMEGPGRPLIDNEKEQPLKPVDALHLMRQGEEVEEYSNNSVEGGTPVLLQVSSRKRCLVCDMKNIECQEGGTNGQSPMEEEEEKNKGKESEEMESNIEDMIISSPAPLSSNHKRAKKGQYQSPSSVMDKLEESSNGLRHDNSRLQQTKKTNELLSPSSCVAAGGASSTTNASPVGTSYDNKSASVAENMDNISPRPPDVIRRRCGDGCDADVVGAEGVEMDFLTLSSHSLSLSPSSTGAIALSPSSSSSPVSPPHISLPERPKDPVAFFLLERVDGHGGNGDKVDGKKSREVTSDDLENEMRCHDLDLEVDNDNDSSNKTKTEQQNKVLSRHSPFSPVTRLPWQGEESGLDLPSVVFTKEERDDVGGDHCRNVGKIDSDTLADHESSRKVIDGDDCNDYHSRHDLNIPRAKSYKNQPIGVSSPQTPDQGHHSQRNTEHLSPQQEPPMLMRPKPARDTPRQSTSPPSSPFHSGVETEVSFASADIVGGRRSTLSMRPTFFLGSGLRRVGCFSPLK